MSQNITVKAKTEGLSSFYLNLSFSKSSNIYIFHFVLIVSATLFQSNYVFCIVTLGVNTMSV